MIRVVTIEREYGSGGPAIAQKLADRLGWTLWDRRLTREIARLADCDLAAVERREERKDPLYYRLFKSFLRGSFEASLQVHRLKVLDSDRILAITQRVVREADRRRKLCYRRPRFSVFPPGAPGYLPRVYLRAV